jgi:hypothetical protein
MMTKLIIAFVGAILVWGLLLAAVLHGQSLRPERCKQRYGDDGEYRGDTYMVHRKDGWFPEESLRNEVGQ